MKKLRTIYRYGLNKNVKISNLKQGKLFSPLPRFGNRPENLEKRRVYEPTKFNTTETLLDHIATFPQKDGSDNFRKISERMKVNGTEKASVDSTT